MRRWLPWLLLALLCAGFWLAGTPRPASSLPAKPGPPASAAGAVAQAESSPSLSPAPQQPLALPGFLPPEASETIALIRRDGPFPHRQDGGVFGNREGRLPPQARGWYREYTVDTPGLRHRGARRIVTGGAPPSAWYYTADHYDSFRRFDPGNAAR